MNIHVQVFVWTYAFDSLGYIPRSGIPGSYGNSTFKYSQKLPDRFPKQPLLWVELRSPKIHKLKSSPPVPRNVIVFGDKAFKKVIKVK